VWGGAADAWRKQNLPIVKQNLKERAFSIDCYIMTTTTLALQTVERPEELFKKKMTRTDASQLVAFAYTGLPTLSMLYALLATFANRGIQHVPDAVPGRWDFLDVLGPASAFSRIFLTKIG